MDIEPTFQLLDLVALPFPPFFFFFNPIKKNRSMVQMIAGRHGIFQKLLLVVDLFFFPLFVEFSFIVIHTFKNQKEVSIRNLRNLAENKLKCREPRCRNVSFAGPHAGVEEALAVTVVVRVREEVEQARHVADLPDYPS